MGHPVKNVRVVRALSILGAGGSRGAVPGGGTPVMAHSVYAAPFLKPLLQEPTMSRKHFIAIAQAIRENIHDQAQRQAVANALLPALRGSNPNFNTSRFLEAAVG